MHKYKIGDKVPIVKKRVNGMNTHGKMDHWLGKYMTVRALLDPSFCSSFGYKMEEDRHEMYNDGWDWYENMIDHEATELLNKKENQVYEFMEEIEVKNLEEDEWENRYFSHFNTNGTVYTVTPFTNKEKVFYEKNAYLCTPWKFHRKARKTIWVNGVEVPAPETTAPNNGQPYYVPAPGSMGFCLEYNWGCGEHSLRMLERGLVYLEAGYAVARGKAMSIYKEEDQKHEEGVQ